MRSREPSGPRTSPRPPEPKWRAHDLALLGLVALVPALFYRGTEEMFEVPKVALLVTGALLLAGWAVAGELAALAREGASAWLQGVGARLWAFPRRDPLGAAVVLYLLSAAASTLASPNPALSFFGASGSTAGLRTALATAAVYFAARALPGSARVFDRIAAAAAIGAVAAAGYSLVQLAGLDPFIWSGTARMFGVTLRIFGTLGHPNFLGAYLAMALPLVAHRAEGARSPTTRAGWLALAAVSLVSLVATLSRAAWLGFAAATLAWIWLRRIGPPAAARRGDKAARSRPDSRRMPAAAALVILAGIALPLASSSLRPALVARVRQIADLRAPTNQSRLQIWRAGLRMAGDHPVLGAGLGAFAVVFPTYRTPAYWHYEWGATPAKAHNEAIHILATQGTLGAGTALLVLLLTALAAWRVFRNAVPGVRRAAVSATAALIAFAIQDLASFTVVGLGVLAATLAGWLAAAATDSAAGKPTPPRPRPLWAMALVAALVTVAMGPLVVRPLTAQLAERRAGAAPAGGPEWDRALAQAEAAAPYDAHYPARFALERYGRAQAERDRGRRRTLLEEGLAAARRAVAIEPQSGFWRLYVARFQADLARLSPPGASAAEVSDAVYGALARDSANAQVLDDGGNALYQVGLRGEARALALRSLRLYPDFAEPLALMGMFALKEGRLADGTDTLVLALRRDWKDARRPHASAWSNLSVAYLAAGRVREARDAAAEALRLEPDSQILRDNLARAEQRLSMGSVAGDSLAAGRP